MSLFGTVVHYFTVGNSLLGCNWRSTFQQSCNCWYLVVLSWRMWLSVPKTGFQHRAHEENWSSRTAFLSCLVFLYECGQEST